MRMGPAAPDGDFMYFEEFKDEKKALEFTLDTNFKTTGQENNTLQYPEIDKDKYLEKYKSDKKIKQFTSNFENNEVHVIYQDLNSKDIVISYETL